MLEIVRYILDGVVMPYIEQEFINDNLFYCQDSSPIHRANIVSNWLNRNFTSDQLIQTPPKFPVINPIENARARQKLRVSKDGIYANKDDCGYQ